MPNHHDTRPYTADELAAAERFKASYVLPEHRGAFHWRNRAELVWECDDDCPHPGHEEDH